MKIIIIEDEKLAAEKLAVLVSELIPGSDIIAATDSVEQTVNILQSPAILPDLIFMDIHLSDGSCFNIFNQVSVKAPVIFTTAYDQYAIEAFRFNSVDYLLKPVTRLSLTNAIEKYHDMKQLWSSLHIIDYSLLAEQLLGKTGHYKQRFMVRSGNKFITIDMKDVAAFEAEGKYVFLIRKDGKKFIVNFTLEALEEALDPDIFFRINRKYLLHIDGIEAIFPYFKGRLKVKSSVLADTELIISSEKAGLFKEWLER